MIAAPGELVRPFAEQLLSDYDKEFNASHLTWKDFAGQARKLLAMILPAHEAMVRAEVGAEMDALQSTPPTIIYGGGCVECDEAFEPGEAVTWRWRYAPAGPIHDECRREGDKPPLTEAEIRADERATVAEEARQLSATMKATGADAAALGYFANKLDEDLAARGGA